MWREERYQKIREHLAAHGQLSVDRVAGNLGVSRETIRRDLMDMEKAGELRRLRGGAVPASKQISSYDVRVVERLQEKRAIAAAALRLLRNGMTIFMESGATTHTMAEALAGPSGLSDITVITNSCDIAAKLVDRSEKATQRFRVVMLGGDFKHAPMETFGAGTINDIHRYHADVTLVSPWSVDARMGATNSFPYMAELARAMVMNCDKTILLADHSKICAPPRTAFCSVEDIDHLITVKASRNIQGFESLNSAISEIIIAD